MMSFFAGLDVKCEACQRFFRDGLTISFTKILTDEAVSGWKFEIHVSLNYCFTFTWTTSFDTLFLFKIELSSFMKEKLAGMCNISSS